MPSSSSTKTSRDAGKAKKSIVKKPKSVTSKQDDGSKVTKPVERKITEPLKSCLKKTSKYDNTEEDTEK